MTHTPGPLGQRTAAEIRAELARQKKSGRWLADMIGAPHNTVSRWIGGDTAPPLDALYAICRALGINVADLIADALAGEELEPVVPMRRRRSQAAEVPSIRSVTSRSSRGCMSATRTLSSTRPLSISWHGRAAA